MTQKTTVTFDGIFLHDTPTAALEAEQRILRAAFNRAQPSAPFPFSFLPPFCPGFDLERETAEKIAPGRLEIGSPVTIDGWILRPLVGPEAFSQSDRKARSEQLPVQTANRASASLPAFPGYPPLPARAGFILGFAGGEADRILEESFPAQEPETRKPKGNANEIAQKSTGLSFSVKVWYRATLTVRIEYDGTGFYCAAYEAGPAEWQKAGR